MTRSGCVAAAAFATRSNGHAAGSSHDRKMPKLETMRHPVSPRITTRFGDALGSGSDSPSTLARDAFDGIAASHVATGNADALGGGRSDRDGRTGMVSAGMRSVIAMVAPSTSGAGHCGRAVITRAIATPSGPRTTYL